MKMASIKIADFKAATIRAVKAGYQVMEIHALTVFIASVSFSFIQC
jgi:2,4-dienoyl-CoA reductase-like NADH-dependent reductase (Old Yellow Enzyme family)